MGGKPTKILAADDFRMRKPECLAAFTLVELLIVIGIIALLIGMIIPSMESARATARAVQCQSNLRQIGIILQIYANDNNGWVYPVGPEMNGKPTTLGTDYPPHLRWPMRVSGFDMEMPDPLPYDPAQYRMMPYDPVKFPAEPFTPKAMLCPSDEEPAEAHSYLLNQHLADKKIRVASRDFGGLGSGEVVVAGEKQSKIRDYYMEKNEFDRVVEKYRHGVRRGSNYLFFDGHVDVLLPEHALGGVDPWEPPVPDATSKPTG